MKFPFPVVEAVLIKREKRFLTHALLPDGKKVIAHCPNPGSMKGNAEPGSKIWLMDFGTNHESQGRKLRYKWLFVEVEGSRVCIDTSLGNTVVGEALRAGLIEELSHYKEIQPEFSVGDSRFDFFLPAQLKHPDAFVEVKSVSMGEGKRAAFPDSVTKRGQKHVKGLSELAGKKKRAVLFFLNMREQGKTVSTAKEIDPEYDRLLREGVERGLEVLVYGIRIEKDGIVLGKRGVLDLT